MYSPGPRRRTWRTHRFAKSNTTGIAQVAEPAPGVLDDAQHARQPQDGACGLHDARSGAHLDRKHVSSGARREPVCMASLLHVPAEAERSPA
ncbi:MAG: hypothetical protein ACLUYV_05220 [Alistipes shahii]